MAKKGKKKKKSPRMLKKKMPPNIKQMLEEYVRQERFDVVKNIARRLAERYPHVPDLYRFMYIAGQETYDLPMMLESSYKWRETSPQTADAQLMYGMTCSNCGFVFTARDVFASVQNKQLPEHYQVVVSDYLAMFDAELPAFRAQYPFGDDEHFEQWSLALEQSKILANIRSLDKALEVAQALKEEIPTYADIYNHIATIHWLKGDFAKATEYVSHIIEHIDKEDIFALASLVHYACCQGDMEQAKQWADLLRPLPPTEPEQHMKKAETFSLLGDAEQVMEIFKAYQQDEGEQPVAELYHFAGIASLMLGHEEDGMQYLQRATELDPAHVIARQNLENLQLPEEERSAPWSHSATFWLPEPLFHDLEQFTDDLGLDTDVPAALDTLRAAHPDVEVAYDNLLTHCGPSGYILAIPIAFMLEDRKKIDTIKAFAEGQRGEARIRQQVLQLLCILGEYPHGSFVQMWRLGEQIPVLLFGATIDANIQRNPDVSNRTRDVVLRGLEAMKKEDFEAAEKLFRKAHKQAPDEPSIVNNLCGALRSLGREEEGMEMFRQLMEAQPDYPSGRCIMATMSASEGKFKEAQEWLRPLHDLTEWHPSEFSTFCHANCTFYHKQEETQKAEVWFDLWKRMLPDDPGLHQWKIEFGKLSEMMEEGSLPGQLVL
ncbi:MAG TPA: hypothetical protein DCE42_03725 [Myxococcales bacterium]|nr:hypothetical protein [Deltaproteobacteria bacterium]HAA53834.1 hypothetical protein [Myxococcales bacterium]|tara:strand:- start:5790 stop:7769 length:1980 start_codon:yes stop_codon:yes gene_type:complete